MGCLHPNGATSPGTNSQSNRVHGCLLFNYTVTNGRVWYVCCSLFFFPESFDEFFTFFFFLTTFFFLFSSFFFFFFFFLPTGVSLLLTWETKDQNAMEGFVVVVTVVSFLCLFLVVWSLVSLQWLGLLEKVNGIESMVPIVSAFCCAITGSWGSTIMSDWISQASPQILLRIDEDDWELLSFTRYAVGFHVTTYFLSFFWTALSLSLQLSLSLDGLNL